jgi:hypothetical protein
LQNTPEIGRASPNQCDARWWRWRRGPPAALPEAWPCWSPKPAVQAKVIKLHDPSTSHSYPRLAGPPLPVPGARPAARPQFPRGPRPGRGRGGPGGGPRTCGRRQRVSRPCPACWNSSRPRSRSPLRASVVSAARLRSLPPARWPDPPRGSAATQLGTWAAAEPYGKMAARCRPHHAALGLPGHGAGVAAAAGGESVPRHARVAVCTERWRRRRSAARAGSRVFRSGGAGRGRGGRVRLGTTRAEAPPPACPPPYGEMATPALPLRRAWLPRLPVAVSRSSPSERRHGQSAAGQGRWTQVRRADACPVAGGLPWPPAGAEAGVLGWAGRASPQRSVPGSRGHSSAPRPPALGRGPRGASQPVGSRLRA